MLFARYVKALESRSNDPFLRDTLVEEAIERIDYDFRNWCDAVYRIAVSTIRNRRARQYA